MMYSVRLFGVVERMGGLVSRRYVKDLLLMLGMWCS